ncbi:MAG: DUF4922 domain-containing protein [Patescibacteria group bacterium]
MNKKDTSYTDYLKPLDHNMNLSDQITALIKQQFKVKPQVVKFIFSPKKAYYISIGKFNIQVNPERHPDVRKVMAKGKAGCFLCPENMPKEERGIMLDKDWSLYPNPSPYEKNHCVLVYNKFEEHPHQIINRHIYVEKALELIWQLCYKEARQNFNLTFNSVGAAASSAHFHFQLFECDLPITNHLVNLTNKENLKIGRVVGYDAIVLVIDGEYTDKNELISEIFLVLDTLNMAFIPYNLLIKVINNRIRVFLYPRSREYPDVCGSDLCDIRFGICEMSGMAIVYANQIATNIKAEDFAKALHSTTIAQGKLPAALDSAYLEYTKVKVGK